jgi:hypothetical protein
VLGVHELLQQHGLEYKFSRACITLAEFQRACATTSAIWPPNGAYLPSKSPRTSRTQRSVATRCPQMISRRRCSPRPTTSAMEFSMRLKYARPSLAILRSVGTTPPSLQDGYEYSPMLARYLR